MGALHHRGSQRDDVVSSYVPTTHDFSFYCLLSSCRFACRDGRKQLRCGRSRAPSQYRSKRTLLSEPPLAALSALHAILRALQAAWLSVMTCGADKCAAAVIIAVALLQVVTDNSPMFGVARTLRHRRQSAEEQCDRRPVAEACQGHRPRHPRLGVREAASHVEQCRRRACTVT